MQSGAYVAPDKTTVAQFLERWLAHIKTQIGVMLTHYFARHSECTRLALVRSSGMYGPKSILAAPGRRTCQTTTNR
jgi:hypothetical protein